MNQTIPASWLIGEIGSQVGDIARMQGQINATKAAKEKMSGANQSDRDKALAELKKQDPTKQYSDDDINKQVYNNFYNQVFNESGFGTGGKVQQVIHAATTAVQGLAGGDLEKAIAGGSAPYIANIIGSSGLDDTGKVLAHAAVNAAMAAAQGNSALVGAAGAATAEMAGMIAMNIYGKPVGELSEAGKQTVSALATLAAGLAGGLAGNGTADVVAAAQAGKTTVENNWLSGLEGFGTGFQNNVQAQGSLVNNTNLTDENGKVLNPATPEQIKYASDKLVTGDLPAGQNAATGLLTAWGAGMTTVVAPVLLPATATAGSIIGAGAIGGSANVFNQLNSGGPFSATDALIATGISGLTQGKGFWFTEAASIGGAYAGAKLQGKDAAAPMIGAGFGTLGGATIGKGVERLQTTIPQFTIPKITGAVAESAGSEYLGSSAQNLAEKVQQKLEKKNDAK